MGLGLAMVRNIVRESGGRVLAESEPGRGSSFTILLPRTNAPVAREQTDGEALELAVGPQTVLLVDDEESIRKVARRILENRGYHVIEAAGGEEALEVIRDPTRHLDVLLTDLVMPGIGGRQLMALCADERPSLPVICLTGYAGEADDPRQYGENLVALLSKPFSSDVLARTVATAVGRRSLS